MNTTATRSLRAKLAAGEPVYGLWVTLDAPSVTEMAVALGLDWVVIDAEHGQLDWDGIVGHLRAAVRSETVALVRIADLDRGLIKRALDLGADGVVVPWIETEEQAARAVSFARYPPEGLRGIGAERATAWGEAIAEHASEANDHVLVVPIIETVKGEAEAARIAGVDGVEIVFLGPADFSASAGFRGQWQGPGVADRLLAIKDGVRQKGKHCGVVAAGPTDVAERLEQGFRVLALGIDGGLLLRSLHAMLGAVGRDRKIRASLRVEPDVAPKRPAPLPRPAASMRPERPEVMTPVGSGKFVGIEPGVRLECLVGAHVGARGLTTGLVTFAPSASLSAHTHPFSESITLLKGQGVVEVEGRCYALAPLDNVVVPKGFVHLVRNASGKDAAVYHVALAGDSPARTICADTYEKRPMPAGSTGVKGAERVTRHLTAVRFEAGPNTSFIDEFNRELMPGIEMSGGYGKFGPGGRLPAHVHDFDESISIIEGEAVCVVEGREYTLRDGATACVPRGRVHYFRNDSDAPMAMIWVYAGPMPERIIVDETCATAEGNPWREEAPR